MLAASLRPGLSARIAMTPAWASQLLLTTITNEITNTYSNGCPLGPGCYLRLSLTWEVCARSRPSSLTASCNAQIKDVSLHSTH